MPLFIKTETIKKDFLIDSLIKQKTIKHHIKWVKDLKANGLNIKSGFLIDEYKKPGGGGFLIVECNSFKDASKIIKDDPMIKNNLVEWKLHEWIDVI